MACVLGCVCGGGMEEGESRSIRRKPQPSGVVSTYQFCMLSGSGIEPGTPGEKRMYQPLR
ncbi:hypothetical protein DPMN_032362 [Dreissena polymorpha]|uniref:Uncharacterized protein n=1 Tax=Dreissena polymorpha TaxID=45954 RepID=A0A9D4M6F1_DREPO|nr:hypothetical protein DPMN_032362 [Dreissena polymorpha]